MCEMQRHRKAGFSKPIDESAMGNQVSRMDKGASMTLLRQSLDNDNCNTSSPSHRDLPLSDVPESNSPLYSSPSVCTNISTHTNTHNGTESICNSKMCTYNSTESTYNRAASAQPQDPDLYGNPCHGPYKSGSHCSRIMSVSANSPNICQHCVAPQPPCIKTSHENQLCSDVPCCVPRTSPAHQCCATYILPYLVHHVTKDGQVHISHCPLQCPPASLHTNRNSNICCGVPNGREIRNEAPKSFLKSCCKCADKSEPECADVSVRNSYSDKTDLHTYKGSKELDKNDYHVKVCSELHSQNKSSNLELASQETNPIPHLNINPTLSYFSDTHQCKSTPVSSFASSNQKRLNHASSDCDMTSSPVSPGTPPNAPLPCFDDLVLMENNDVFGERFQYSNHTPSPTVTDLVARTTRTVSQSSLGNLSPPPTPLDSRPFDIDEWLNDGQGCLDNKPDPNLSADCLAYDSATTDRLDCLPVQTSEAKASNSYVTVANADRYEFEKGVDSFSPCSSKTVESTESDYLLLESHPVPPYLSQLVDPDEDSYSQSKLCDSGNGESIYLSETGSVCELITSPISEDGYSISRVDQKFGLSVLEEPPGAQFVDVFTSDVDPFLENISNGNLESCDPSQENQCDSSPGGGIVSNSSSKVLEIQPDDDQTSPVVEGLDIKLSSDIDLPSVQTRSEKKETTYMKNITSEDISCSKHKSSRPMSTITVLSNVHSSLTDRKLNNSSTFVFRSGNVKVSCSSCNENVNNPVNTNFSSNETLSQPKISFNPEIFSGKSLLRSILDDEEVSKNIDTSKEQSPRELFFQTGRKRNPINLESSSTKRPRFSKCCNKKTIELPLPKSGLLTKTGSLPKSVSMPKTGPSTSTSRSRRYDGRPKTKELPLPSSVLKSHTSNMALSASNDSHENLHHNIADTSKSISDDIPDDILDLVFNGCDTRGSNQEHLPVSDLEEDGVLSDGVVGNSVTRDSLYSLIEEHACNNSSQTKTKQVALSSDCVGVSNTQSFNETKEPPGSHHVIGSTFSDKSVNSSTMDETSSNRDKSSDTSVNRSSISRKVSLLRAAVTTPNMDKLIEQIPKIPARGGVRLSLFDRESQNSTNSGSRSMSKVTLISNNVDFLKQNFQETNELKGSVGKSFSTVSTLIHRKSKENKSSGTQIIPSKSSCIVKIGVGHNSSPTESRQHFYSNQFAKSPKNISKKSSLLPTPGVSGLTQPTSDYNLDKHDTLNPNPNLNHNKDIPKVASGKVKLQRFQSTSSDPSAMEGMSVVVIRKEAGRSRRSKNVAIQTDSRREDAYPELEVTQSDLIVYPTKTLLSNANQSMSVISSLDVTRDTPTCSENQTSTFSQFSNVTTPSSVSDQSTSYLESSPSSVSVVSCSGGSELEKCLREGATSLEEPGKGEVTSKCGASVSDDGRGLDSQLFLHRLLTGELSPGTYEKLDQKLLEEERQIGKSSKLEKERRFEFSDIDSD